MLDRLPKYVAPRHYTIFLEPDIENFSFTGHVDIQLEVLKPTNSIVINAVNLTTSNTKIGNMESIGATVEEQTITYFFAEAICGSEILRIDFEGVINTSPIGLFASEYLDSDGNKATVLATQMEVAGCRQLIPCFDEPSFKATFDMSLAAPVDLVVLGNAAVQIEEMRVDGKMITHFDTTPLMSSYLLALVVGDLRSVESQKFRLPVKAWTVPGRENEACFGVDTAAQVLALFESTFRIPFPLSKVDLVAASNQQGAMENWGLIILTDSSLLWNQQRDSISDKQRVSAVVIHELAHQWFGNLVTMEWWDALWLNEGFASWAQMYASNILFPEWNVWDKYVGTSLQDALKLDALRASHPIEVPLARYQDITLMFDAVTYLKGAGVIRMLVSWLGEERFFVGLRNYLTKFKFSNATTQDLWAELGGQEIAEMMQPWTQQPGYPVLQIREIPSTQSQGEVTIEVVQHRFLSTGKVDTDEDIVYPLWIGEVHASRTSILKTRSSTFVVPANYKLNADNTGLYRVCYPPEHLSKLVSDSSSLSIKDKIGLLADVAALSGSLVETSQLLDLVDSWRAEQNTDVWLQLLSALAGVANTFGFENQLILMYNSFYSTVVMDRLQTLPRQTGEQSESYYELTGALFSAAAKLENPRIISESLSRYRRAKDKTAIDSLLRPGVYCVVSRHGTCEEWHNLFRLAVDSASIPRTQILAALGSTSQKSLLIELLNSSLTDTFLDLELSAAFNGATLYSENALTTWEWLKSNWDKLEAKFPPLSIGTHLVSLVASVLPHLVSTEALKDFEEFFATHGDQAVRYAVEQCREKVQTGLLTISRDSEGIIAWLQKRGY